MRTRTIVLVIIIWGLLFSCTLRKRITYTIPDDIKGEQREAVIKSIETGRRLYERHCAGCHGIFKKGVDGMPNFTDKQIDMYTAYAIKRDPKNHSVAAHMDTEQLHDVFLFLKSRKIKSVDTGLERADIRSK